MLSPRAVACAAFPLGCTCQSGANRSVKQPPSLERLCMHVSNGKLCDTG